MSHADIDARILSSAFHEFTRASEQLAESYQLLERQIDLLADVQPASDDNAALQSRAESPPLDLASLLDTLPVAVLVVDGYGSVVYENSMSAALLGEPVTGMRWAEVIAAHFTADSPGDDVVLANGRIVSLSLSPRYDRPGQIIAFKDVTRTREAQAILAKKQKTGMLENVCGALAHQIKTPLSSIALYLSRFEDGKTSRDDLPKYAGKIREAVDHLHSLVVEMLDFSSGKKTNQDVNNVREMLEESVKVVAAAAEGKGIEVGIRCETESESVSVNREMFISIVGNILMNSIEACKRDTGRIEVMVGRGVLAGMNSAAVKVVIEDNGAGIKQSDIDRIFEAFYTTKEKGTGIGLAVAKDAVNSWGGAIEVASQPGCGTRVTMIFPEVTASSKVDNKNG